ncbi:uncharacterized protein METZ01_LOCUS203881, partial [marine metagenome]
VASIGQAFSADDEYETSIEGSVQRTGRGCFYQDFPQRLASRGTQLPSYLPPTGSTIVSVAIRTN